MVAVINVSSSLRRVLNYNENKVQEGLARLIGAENCPVDPDALTYRFKLNFLLRRMELNQNVKRNTMHISLNFDPSENGLSDSKLVNIASAYMEKLGFGEQPYLIYQHLDAGHPHIHIISTNIRFDGSRIDLHHLAIRKSEPARKAVEKQFNLVHADGKRNKPYQLEPIPSRQIEYGKKESKKALNAVLRGTLDIYRFTSLPELNVLLKQYNVQASRGGEQSRIYKTGGLVFRILDKHGKPVGVPIKASDFSNKPTLKNLETKFSANQIKRMPYKSELKRLIDQVLVTSDIPLEVFTKSLSKEGVHVSLRQNEQGRIYGITYVDHRSKCIFNGSDLGKAYSAMGIVERCSPKRVSEEKLPLLKQFTRFQPRQAAAKTSQPEKGFEANEGVIGLVDQLFQPDSRLEHVPQQLKKPRKKRRKPM